MKTKLSPNRFYLSNIIFYTCLLAFPSSAVELIDQPEGSSDNEWCEIHKESSTGLTEDEQIIALPNNFRQLEEKNVQLKKKNKQLEKKNRQLENVLSLIISMEPKRKDGMTPFLCTAQKGQLAIAKLLRQRGADINAKDEDGNNALHLACCCSGSEVMVNWLLDVCKIGLETKGYKQKTPFLSAAQEGQLEIAKLFRQRGANIEAKNEDGNNALHLACLFSGSVAMVTWLLDVCKIGLETKGNYNQTPFLSAAEKGQLAIAKLLKQRGANIHAKDKNGDSALHSACLFSGSVAMATWLLEVCKIDLETKGRCKKTPFLCAAQKGRLEIAKLLKKRGANIDAKSVFGNNALHFACLFSGSEVMVNWLLDECKIDLETKGKCQKTPFLSAAQGGQLEIAKLLRQRGANIEAKNEDGNNALYYAKEHSGSKAMISYLLNVGVES